MAFRTWLQAFVKRIQTLRTLDSGNLDRYRIRRDTPDFLYAENDLELLERFEQSLEKSRVALAELPHDSWSYRQNLKEIEADEVFIKPLRSEYDLRQARLRRSREERLKTTLYNSVAGAYFLSPDPELRERLEQRGQTILDNIKRSWTNNLTT